MVVRSQTWRTLLVSFVASLATCAVVGIWCLLFQSWGPVQGRVLMTTAVLAVASVLGMAAAFAWERRSWHPVGPAGCCAVAVALVLVLSVIWWVSDPSEDLLKTLGIASVFAFGLPLVALLSLSRLRADLAWVRTATVLLLAVLAAQLIYAILAQPDDDLFARLVGVVSIAASCGAVAVPILHRLSAIPAERDARGWRLATTCPRCGHGLELSPGRSSCPACGLGFRIDIDS